MDQRIYDETQARPREPCTLEELVPNPIERQTDITTTSGNHLVYLGRTESGDMQFVGRTTSGFLSMFSASPSARVEKGRVAGLRYEGEITRSMSRYADLNNLLTKRGIPELK